MQQNGTQQQNTTTFIFEGSFRTEQPLATCSKDLKDRDGGPGKPIPVPRTWTPTGPRLMYPSTGIRGRWRRSCRDVVRDVVIKATGDPTPFSLDQHYLLTLGGIKGGGAQDRSTVAMEAHWRAKNPLLSLFGAGDAGVLGFVHGHLSVGNAVVREAVDAAIFGDGARRDGVYAEKSQLKFLSEDDIRQLICRAQGGRQRSEIEKEIKSVEKNIKKAMREGKEDVAGELRQTLSELEARVANVKTQTGTSDVSVGMPLSGWQAIPAGVTMDHRILLVRSNDIELGLLLCTLNEFATRSPLLGAHFANGHGLVSGEWTVSQATISGCQTIGTVSFQPYEPLAITYDSGKLSGAMQAFDAFAASQNWDFSIPSAVES